jgi:lysozyme family protein
VSEYSPRIAEELLDTGVNMGVGTASKFLQRALNTLNAEGKYYPDITVDGAIGQMTLASLKAFLAHRGDNGHVVLVRMLNALQGVRYIEIAEAKPSQEAFIYGWFLSRVA